ncbi:hypothetical protein [Eubacterium limosum]|uniref:hypothetical protein n=1 Tax=Eubacterium limosum TaxID=1736 RepID=UPI0022E95714|nr:hypothetical protein [Eubacterium limosum]
MNVKSVNKKWVVVIASVGVLAIALISITMALLNKKTEAALNPFSGSAVNIGVVENNKIYEDGKNQVTGFDQNALTNGGAEKVVQIKNMNKLENSDTPDADYPTTDTVVRVRLVPCIRYDETDPNYGGQVVPVDIKNVSYHYNGSDGVNFNKWESKQEAAVSGDTTSKQETYYYYKTPLAPGKTTEALFDRVTYTGDIPENAHFELQVLAEGAAAKQNAGQDKKPWDYNFATTETNQ